MKPRTSPPVPLPADELYLYRKHVTALLRRYFRVSLEIGRLPSLLGGEVFRARLTSYRLQSFEDLVIFAHDVERCLESLAPFRRNLVVHVIFQGYTPEEASRLLHCAHLTARRGMAKALDELAVLFLQKGLLRLFLHHAEPQLFSCQEPQTGKMNVSRCR